MKHESRWAVAPSFGGDINLKANTRISDLINSEEDPLPVVFGAVPLEAAVREAIFIGRRTDHVGHARGVSFRQRRMRLPAGSDRRNLGI